MNNFSRLYRTAMLFHKRTGLWAILCASLVFSNISEVRAQLYDVDTLLYHGDVTRFINFVILSDGYRNTQLDTFVENAQTVSDYLFSISPFAEYKSYFNVFAIKVPSPESGADHPATATDVTEPVIPVAMVNNNFNSTFDYFNIHRLLVPQNYQAINSALLNNMQHYDQALILVNSPEYGGSGGAHATSSAHTAAAEIFAHEVGHSFADLSDEYYAGDFYAGESVNMTQETDPLRVRWKNWIGTDGVGIYQHCCGDNSSLWYRPHQNCKMRALGAPFCPVCKEAIVERIHQFFGTPIISKLPAEPSVTYCADPISFSISLVHPVPNTLKVTWKLNDNLIALNVDSLLIVDSLLQIGLNTLVAECTDTTWFSRSEQHPSVHTYNTTWTIGYELLLPPVITPGSDTEFCQGDSVILTSSPAAIYQWSHGPTTQSTTIRESGSYTVTITDVYGCTAPGDFVTVTVNAPPGNPFITAIDSFLISSAATGNQWYLYGEPIPGAVSDTLLTTENGIYTVIVTDTNGCTAESEPFEYETSAVDDQSIPTALIVLPNPNDGTFRIIGEQLQNAHARIYSLFGVQVFSSTLIDEGIVLTDYPEGIYFLEVYSRGQRHIVKLVIQK